MNTIKKIITEQCEKVIKEIIEDNSTASAAYTTLNYACRTVSCCYNWSKNTIYKCHAKVFGLKNAVSKQAYRYYKKESNRKATMGNQNIINL